MARKTAQYTVPDEGRDKGKVFFLTEMSASRAESWATRILLALMGSNPNLPDNFSDLGMAGLAELGLKAIGGLKWEIAEPLLEEMMSCVQIMPNPAKPQVVRALVESDIEEILTRFRLRVEVWNLHMDFLSAVAPSFSKSMKSAAKESQRPPIATSAK